jgi:hypothetical protein
VLNAALLAAREATGRARNQTAAIHAVALAKTPNAIRGRLLTAPKRECPEKLTVTLDGARASSGATGSVAS